MTAADTAAAEATGWADLALEWRPDRHLDSFADLAAREADVVRFHDPADDLVRRMRRWGYPPGDLDLSDLARFAAGLARAEADGWANDEAHVATRAYEDRRFLLGDRILHWAVPWLVALGRDRPQERDRAAAAGDWLLGVGDTMRPAPALASGEGRFQPGHDAIGPFDTPSDVAERVLSAWSGAVITGATLSAVAGSTVLRSSVPELLGDAGLRRDLAGVYVRAAADWQSTADRHPGSAEIWTALGRRAAATAEALATTSGR